MSQLDRTQTEIAHLLFGLPEAAGYALAGGGALLAHGAIDRPTRDLDAFIQALPTQPPGDVAPLASALTAELESHDWTVEPIRNHRTFTRLTVTRRDDTVEIDLAVDSPRLFPTTTIDDIPTLDPATSRRERSSPSSTEPRAATSPTSKHYSTVTPVPTSSAGPSNSMTA